MKTLIFSLIICFIVVSSGFGQTTNKTTQVVTFGISVKKNVQLANDIITVDPSQQTAGQPSAIVLSGDKKNTRISAMLDQPLPTGTLLTLNVNQKITTNLKANTAIDVLNDGSILSGNDEARIDLQYRLTSFGHSGGIENRQVVFTVTD